MNHAGRKHLWPCVTTIGLAFSFSALAADQAASNAAAAQFKALDTNNDGRLSPDEHAAGAKKIVEAMDANTDGKVTDAEMDAAHDRMAGKKAGAKDLSSTEKIKVIDTNGDGILTAAEHAAGTKAMFDRMDTDKDGFLSQAELAEGHARMLHRQDR